MNESKHFRFRRGHVSGQNEKLYTSGSSCHGFHNVNGARLCSFKYTLLLIRLNILIFLPILG